jgi:hypothetical protein
MRCHASDGVVWLCKRSRNKELIWFFPSGVRYPVDERRPLVSSTTIRKHLNSMSRDDAYDVIKEQTLNPEVLLTKLKVADQYLKVGWRRPLRRQSIDSDVLVETLQAANSPGLTLAKEFIRQLAYQAVFLGRIEVRPETKDDMALYPGGAVGRKRSASI